MKLENKVAIITGAASGIGNGIAKLYAKEGAKVVIADLDLEKSTAAAQEIKDAGYDAMGVVMDVTNEEQVNAGVEETVKTYGGVDILISNAGIQHIAPVDELEYKYWKQMLAIHLDGAFLTSKACLKHMYKSGKGGSIIFMGSVHSKEASKLKAPYITAKHGLLGLCRAIATEGADRNVRCNTICPSFVRTPLVEKQIPEQAQNLGLSEEEVIKKVMLGKTIDGEFTTIEDIAQLALFFASFESTALSGQSMLASHGWVME